MTKILRYCVLILPILFLWVGLNFNRAKYANDPDYIYLINALAICNGKSVGHIDNPGTTVMQIGAVTIAITHLLSGTRDESLVTHVLKNPDKFIEAIQTVFLILNTIVLLLLGWVGLKKTHSIWVALLLQSSTFITTNTLDHIWTKVSPEPVLFFITCIFVIAILWFYADNKKESWKYVVIFALISGAGLGTKATYLPLVIFPLVVLPSLKKKIVFIGGIILSFILFTIPAIPEYKRMYFWFQKLISHSGKYGHGKKEFVNIKTYFPNVLRIAENNPIFAVAIGISIVIIIGSTLSSFRKRKEKNWDIKILTGLVASSVFGILLVAKQFNANHYLIPVLLLTGILLFFILIILQKSKFFSIIKGSMLPVIVLSLIIFISWKQPAKIKNTNYKYLISNEEIDSVNTILEQKYPKYTHINYYSYSLNKFTALKFGDVYTKNKMLTSLKKVYPNTYFYDFPRKQILNWDTEISLEEVIDLNGKKILMINGPNNEETAEEIGKRGFPLKKIYKGRVQVIYELDTTKYQPKTKNNIKLFENRINCNSETLTPDKQYYLGSNEEIFGKANTRSNKEAHSGKHSIELDKKTEFALEYNLDKLNAGDIYEIEIWRKPNNKSGHLVVAAKEAKTFYISQNNIVETTSDGWGLIQITFTITPELENETLKIYLWNSKKQQIFFDDLLTDVSHVY